MSNLKSIFAVLLLTAIVSVVPAHAAAPQLKVVIAGSSAMWQTLALGAYNASSCVTGGTKPCHHYTGKSFNLTDSRPTLKGGTAATDQGNLWIVWDSNTTTIHVWAYVKVDSVVGTRCYFAQPRCTVSLPAFPAPSNLITPNTLWGDNTADTAPPAAVAALFTGTGSAITVAATDIRPEDGLYATCRANSLQGGGRDHLDGLGWGTNPSGTCPGSGALLTRLQGGDIVSGLPGSTSSAHVLAFNTSGTDPFSGTAIPAPTTVSVGAAPVVFLTSRTGAPMASVTNASDAQLKTVFSGNNCNASALGAASASIQAYLREPLSGTMNTTEYTVFRYPNANGSSQETGVNANKLSNNACTAGGGGRTRVIGTGEAVKGVQNSNTNFTMDGIAYAFFSYGNVSSIASQAGFGYLQLNGVDGIFASYAGGDPGEPGGGTIPGVANLPASCAGAFPCPESAIWTGHQSFPHLRDGSYRAWSTLRLVSNGTALTNARQLVSKSNLFVVQDEPDYVPFSAVISGTTVLDPGLLKQRSHYGPGAHNTGTAEKGRDAGGCIQAKGSSVINQVQTNPGSACIAFVAP
jgi:hypothetical protein